MKFAHPSGLTDEQVWEPIRNLRIEDIGSQAGHTFENRDNYGRDEDGRLHLLDYGPKRVCEIVEQHEQALREAFDLLKPAL